MQSEVVSFIEPMCLLGRGVRQVSKHPLGGQEMKHLQPSQDDGVIVFSGSVSDRSPCPQKKPAQRLQKMDLEKEIHYFTGQVLKQR